jgi:hypothetical protein
VADSDEDITEKEWEHSSSKGICLCVFYERQQTNSEKVSPRMVKCIFVGYSSIHKGYVC